MLVAVAVAVAVVTMTHLCLDPVGCHSPRFLDFSNYAFDGVGDQKNRRYIRQPSIVSQLCENCCVAATAFILFLLNCSYTQCCFDTIATTSLAHFVHVIVIVGLLCFPKIYNVCYKKRHEGRLPPRLEMEEGMFM